VRNFVIKKLKSSKHTHCQQTEESEHTGQNDKKSQVYFLNSKDDTDKKQKKLDVEESYIPIDFDQRSKELKEKLQKRTGKATTNRETYQSALKVNGQKLEKTTTRKSDTGEEKTSQGKRKEILKKESSEPIGFQTRSEEANKRKKRLQRLKIRQARIEEKRR